MKTTITLSCAVIASALTSATPINAEEAKKPSFVEAGNDIIPLEDRSRRKWDCPIVADLDQDGKMDLILTDHAHHVNVHWNNGGTFSKAEVIKVGDIHGQTVGDIDRDGNMDILIAPGGGNGSKPSQPIPYQVVGRKITEGKAYAHFERCRGRALKLVDINGNGKLELLSTGFLTPEQLKTGANLVYSLNEKNGYDFVARLPHSGRFGYRMLVTDYNNDGDPDLINYGGGHIISLEGGKEQTFTNSTAKVLGKNKKVSHVSTMVEIDFDNDGDMDLFMTRSEHPFEHKSNHDADCGCFAFFSRFKPMKMDDLKIDGDFKLENLQMAFPNFDVMVGEEKRKLKFKPKVHGDRHGHKDFTLKPEEAKGWPEDTSAKGLYIGYLGEKTWRIYSDTKSPTAGVIHNVISTPATLPIKDLPAKLYENRDGVFVDVTKTMGISIPEQTTGCTVADFDNDGWSDLLVIRAGNMATKNEQILYLNQGGKKFVKAENHGIISKELGATGNNAEVFDYDMDGDIDIMYANERGRWHLFTNEFNTAGNNYVTVKIGNSPSGKATALGATLTLKVGDLVYKRRVGQTSSPFGQNANNYLHVGLGKAAKIDSAEVRWSTGETQTLTIDALNQIVTAGKGK